MLKEKMIVKRTIALLLLLAMLVVPLTACQTKNSPSDTPASTPSAAETPAEGSEGTELLEDNLFRYGYSGRMLGTAGEEDLYWRYRLPGFGVIDWKRLFNTLYEQGFDGTVYIENEDPLFCGGPMPSTDPAIVRKRYEGVTLARRFLAGFIV